MFLLLLTAALAEPISVIHPDGGGTHLHRPEVVAPARPAEAPTATSSWTVRQAGYTSAPLRLAIVGDGYPAGSETEFEADLQRALDALDATPPFDPLSATLQIDAWFVPSAEQGISDPFRGIDRTTPFSCNYGCGNPDEAYHRLICCDERTIRDFKAAHGEPDGLLVLVQNKTDDPGNLDDYGGSGSSTYATAYTGSLGPLVAVHELGHSLMDLWDEYTYRLTDEAAYCGGGDDCEGVLAARQGGARNCAWSEEEPPTYPNGEPVPSEHTDPTSLPWSDWVQADPAVSGFSTCAYDNWWRPTQSGCLMKEFDLTDLGADRYCPVCAEHITRELSFGVEDLVTEDAGGVLEAATSLAPALGVPESWLAVSWSLDGEPIAQGPTFDADPCILGAGELAMTASLLPRFYAVPSQAPTAELTWTLDDSTCPVTCGCRQSSGAWGLPALLGLLAFRRRRSSTHTG